MRCFGECRQVLGSGLVMAVSNSTCPFASVFWLAAFVCEGVLDHEDFVAFLRRAGFGPSLSWRTGPEELSPSRLPALQPASSPVRRVPPVSRLSSQLAIP